MARSSNFVLAVALCGLAACGDLNPSSHPTTAGTTGGGSQGSTTSSGAVSGASSGSASAGGTTSAGGTNGGAAVTGPEPADDGVIPTPNRTDWLTVSGNQFMRNGAVWMGRGVTLHDTRSCDFCTSHEPDVMELKRRVDDLVGTWHVNFIRLLLQSFPSAAYTAPYTGDRVQWASFLQDPNYLHDIQEIVEYIGTKPGVYVMVSLWKDPTFTTSATSPSTSATEGGWPTAGTDAEWTKLATVFANDAQVLYGVANEPEQDNTSDDAACESAMSSAVQAIRAAEAATNAHHHIAVVQGTREWGRVLDYYVTHPIAGDNVAYECHPYTSQANFASSIQTPAATLPVIIGEFAPASGYMTQDDCTALMTLADKLNIPWAAWDFHTDCSTGTSNNMLLQGPGTCTYGIALTPTPWGQSVMDHITSKQ